MFARYSSARRAIARFFAFFAMVWLAACDATIDPNANVGQGIDPGDPVQVALLVPRGSGTGSDDFLAQNLENAARLAIADLQGATIELRVYDTAGDPATAAAAAVNAVNDGAKIILGPLYSEAANAVGVAVAGRNVNVLSFSNTTSIAGGNVFVLGATFENTANRLVQYGTRNGINRYLVAYGDDAAGQVGSQAIARAVQNNGGQVVGMESYPLSQQGIFTSTRRIVSSVRSSGAQAVFSTAGAAADLPIIATALPDAGMSENVRFIGLTRWDTVPQLFALPGVQGGLFAMPDQTTATLFADRYTATYGEPPHPLAGLAYDGIAAIGALVAAGNTEALTKAALTSPQGFRGTSGVFRLLPNGLNERALAIATIQENQVIVLEQAQRSFGGAGL
ncbi:amino acid/amide ABC transporter substrate-binding protein, HAAT family [Yoonia tamlensis]|uniref:Amino acid/amide ABC transporter substrate-binding protein, HAAT family n=1 Tax=Yoonia tamlensis TaxID=390270 RepID=A0A1I6GWM9_9RHOB|nr:penicillin-binding protein activator [Yoonia tamlensis]SFR46602.1 amino acid/amide ABC transporter substrate-binding protein, HAAT family [Yoonia tamlensis]